MNTPVLYRRRLIPDELLLLKNDVVLHRDEHSIVTRWDTLRPKKDLHHGVSCYLLQKGVKVSKFYTRDNELICWYCDIVTHSFDRATDTYIFTDLLADVLLYPDGLIKVVDLDELADAAENGLLPNDLLLYGLRRTNWLLSLIYSGSFSKIQAFMSERESRTTQN